MELAINIDYSYIIKEMISDQIPQIIEVDYTK
jgi:hypothetical protein